MRRLRWWFFGLGAAFLIASVAVWRWSERVPYRFLDQGRLNFIGVQPFGGGTLYEEYHFTVPFDSILASARRQIPAPWSEQSYGGSTPGKPSWQVFTATVPDGNLTLLRRHPDNDGKVDRYPPVPPGKTGIVRLVRRANALDRYRAWYFHRKWGGLRP